MKTPKSPTGNLMNSNIINLDAEHSRARRTSDRMFEGRRSTEGILAPPETDLPALTDHPFSGPFLAASRNEVRCRALQRQVLQLETELGSDHPQIALVRFWYAVSHGAECFEEGVLDMLREAEPVIRLHYPEAHRALAMNLAAQGCHVRALRKRDEAAGLLASAFHLMMLHDVAVAADIVKVAEFLADCYLACGAFDDALFILYTAQQFIPGAVEQSELIVTQCEEFRERFIDEHGHLCSQQYQGMVGALRCPRLSDVLPDDAPGQDRSHAPLSLVLPPFPPSTF